MTVPSQLYLRLELVWWLITIVVTALFIAPILMKLPDYPFLGLNLLYIILFITVTRYIFLLRFTFLPPWQKLKVAIIFVVIPVVFYLVEGLNGFQVFLDENGYEAVVGSLPVAEQGPMIKYIKNEMLLFGMGSIISMVILPFRLVVSIWRRHNGVPE